MTELSRLMEDTDYISRHDVLMAFRKCLWSKMEIHPSIGLDEAEEIINGVKSIDVYTEQHVRDAFTDGYSSGYEYGRSQIDKR